MRNWLNAIKRTIQDCWDWWVYRRAHHSLRRMCERQPGFAYLMELWIREWRGRHPISPELERATEAFFESLRDDIERRA